MRRVGVFDPAHVYDILPETISTLTIFSLGFCVFLYLKVGALCPCKSYACDELRHNELPCPRHIFPHVPQYVG